MMLCYYKMPVQSSASDREGESNYFIIFTKNPV